VPAAISKSVISRGGETRCAKCFDSCSTHRIEVLGSSEQRLRPSAVSESSALVTALDAR
jgi:hypothetical protein